MGLAVALIYWLVQHQGVDFSRLSILINFKDISILMILTLLNLIICSERWRAILKSQNFELSAVESMKYTLIGIFFNYAIPGGVGGDVVKGYYISKRNPQSRLKAIMTLAIDRVFGLFSMVMMALLAMALHPHRYSSSPQLKAIFISLLIIFTAMMLFW